MSRDNSAGPAADADRQPPRAPARRVVISSVTGKPIAWEDAGSDENVGQGSAAARERRPVIPDRVREDEPEPGADESNDSRIAGDVPPHWGGGR